MTAILLLMIVAFGCASEGSDWFTVQGKVLASDNADDALAGVTVLCGGTLEETVSRDDGSFTLDCPVPEKADQEAGETAHQAAVMVWFLHQDRTPLVKSLIPVPDKICTLKAVMPTELKQATVTLPVGNRSVPVRTGAMTLSFEQDSLKGPDGIPVTGDATYEAASLDNSRPVEMDEGAGKMTVDALFPAWAPCVLNDAQDEQWLRPLAAGWFDPGPNTINPDIKVGLQLFSQFADEILSRQLSGIADEQLFMLRPDWAVPKLVEGAAITSTNQLSASIDSPGLFVWMAPQESYACFNVTVRKGVLPATGAHLVIFENFGDKKQKFLDEVIGSENENYCLKSVSGKTVLIQASIITENGVSTMSKELLSGGNSRCSETCTPATFVFPCESIDDCENSNACVDGECVVQNG